MSFDTINYLLYEKNRPELDSDLLQEFNPFLTQKIFSFYDSGKYCGYINDTLNTYSSVFVSIEDQFRFHDAIIPKLQRRKWEYIKKEKPKKTKPDKLPVQKIPEFLSQREVDLYKSYSK